MSAVSSAPGIRQCLILGRGIGQVMFQNNALTGLLFLIGIFWGAYASGTPAVGWGAVVGVVASTLSGWLLNRRGEPASDGDQGLWGFNGVLVGCAFPTFMTPDWAMWVALVFCAMLTTWLRRGFNNVMAPWKVNSFTFPFVFSTWVFLLCCHELGMLHGAGMAHPSIEVATSTEFHASFITLVEAWLRGISQVFLIDSWITGLFFLAGLAVSSVRAAVWAAVGAAIALATAVIFRAPQADVMEGLYGFSAVLTAIALGATFYPRNTLAQILWTVAGTIATVFVQACMNALFEPLGLATLTGPFCITTWLFLLPLYKVDQTPAPDHSSWPSSSSK